jgi:hypothetical protein
MKSYIDKQKNKSIKNKLRSNMVDLTIKEINSFIENRHGTIEKLVLDENRYNWLRNVLYCNLKIYEDSIKNE